MNAAEERTLGSRVLSGGLLLLASQGIAVIVTFLAQRMILSELTKDANGELFTVRRLADLIVLSFVDLGINGIAMRRMVQTPGRVSEIVSSLFAFRALAWFVASLVCIAIATTVGLAPADVAMCCLFLFLNSRAGIVRYVLELPSRSVVRFGLVNALSLLDVVLFAVLVFVFRTDLTPSLVLRLFVVSAVPGFLILFALEQRRHLRLSGVSVAEIRSLLVETIPIAVTMVLLIVHDKADAMILSALSNASEVGVFSAAYQSISPLVGTIPSAVVGAMVPAIAHLAVTDRERCSTYARTGLRFMTVAAVGIASVSSCLAPLFIQLVTGGRYQDNVLQFATFLWMPVAIFVLVYVQEFSVALGRQRSYTRVAAVLAGSTILLSILFVPLWQSEGAALAKLVTVVGAAVMAVGLLGRVLEDGRFLSEGLRLTATIVLCAIVSFLLPPVIGQYAAAAVAAATWLSVSVAMGVMGRDDIALVRRMVKGRVHG